MLNSEQRNHFLNSLLMRAAAFLAFSAVSAGMVFAAEPSWWRDSNPDPSQNTSIIDPGTVPNNYGPINQGQLKNVAKKAARYLNQSLPSPGAGAEINALVSGLINDPSTAYQPVNLGQIKAVAKPFYDRLRDLDVNFDTKQSLRNHGTPDWAFDYPWNPDTPVTDNYSPANIGQLKWVFSFDLTGFTPGQGGGP